MTPRQFPWDDEKQLSLSEVIVPLCLLIFGLIIAAICGVSFWGLCRLSAFVIKACMGVS